MISSIDVVMEAMDYGALTTDCRLQPAHYLQRQCRSSTSSMFGIMYYRRNVFSATNMGY